MAGNKTDPELIVPRIADGSRFGPTGLIVGERPFVGVGLEYAFAL
jgi:hypothetical protein